MPVYPGAPKLSQIPTQDIHMKAITASVRTRDGRADNPLEECFARAWSADCHASLTRGRWSGICSWAWWDSRPSGRLAGAAAERRWSGGLGWGQLDAVAELGEPFDEPVAVTFVARATANAPSRSI